MKSEIDGKKKKKLTTYGSANAFNLDNLGLPKKPVSVFSIDNSNKLEIVAISEHMMSNSAKKSKSAHSYIQKNKFGTVI